MTLMERKLRVGLIFGGRSCEHNVSLASASSIMGHLNRNKYDVVPIGITQNGTWIPGITPAKFLDIERSVQVSTNRVNGGEQAFPSSSVNISPVTSVLKEIHLPTKEELDVAFPIVHGVNGEDGTLQGLLEMAKVPYVGCGVLGSALGMDKEKTKMILRSIDLPVVNWLTYRRYEWEQYPALIMNTIEDDLGYPCFVKPVTSGSSIGVSKVRTRKELALAISLAAEYDEKIIVEQAIHCRELECAALGNHLPTISTVGEVMISPDNDFYDYHAKYLDRRSYTATPAKISQELAEHIRVLALRTFQALDLSGLARIDFFLEQKTGQVYINEVNTLPSFTPQCLYPKLCENFGLPYPQLLDRLIELAIERYTSRQRNRVCA